MSRAQNSIFLAFVVLILGGAMAGMQFLGERAQSEPHQPTTAPPDLALPSRGAFAQGGRPERGGPPRVFLKDKLSAFVIELDAWILSHKNQLGDIDASEELAASRQRLLTDAVEAGFEGPLLAALTAMIDAALFTASASDAELKQAADDLLTENQLFNDALANAGLGFFVDVQVFTRSSGSRSVLFFTFEILRVVLYESAGYDVRTLRVRRLDDLSFSYSLVGFTSPRRRDAVVLDHKVDKLLMDYLPAVIEDSRVDIYRMEGPDSYTPWYTETSELAAKGIREEFTRSDNPNLTTLAKLVSRRVAIFEDWSKLLEGHGRTLRVPEKLAVEWNYRERMRGVATLASVEELDEIQEALASQDMREAYALAHDFVAQTVERHEAQHRLDLSGRYRVKMPAFLAEFVGELPEGYRGEGNRASAALAELSAYLSELARDAGLIRTNLSNILRYLIEPRLAGMSESYAALAIFEGLAEELNIDHQPLVERRRIQRDRAAKLFKQLCEVDRTLLREASANLWKRYIGVELPELKTVAR